MGVLTSAGGCFGCGQADTLPQGAVDMNKCTDILDAEAITTHNNSIAVVTPEKTEYFKADSKEEIQWLSLIHI